jgi:signal recognition particle subunit SRP54
MFETLSGKLQNAFRNLRGLGKISESNVGDSLREVRLALLDADVNFKVVKDFIERVRNKSLGQEVIQSIQPGQQIIKIIHDELVELLGSTNAGLNLTRWSPPMFTVRRRWTSSPRWAGSSRCPSLWPRARPMS